MCGPDSLSFSKIIEQRICPSHLGNTHFLSRTEMQFFLWSKYNCSEKKVNLLGQGKNNAIIYLRRNVSFKAWLNVTMNCMGNTTCFYDVVIKCDQLAGEGAWNSDCSEFDGNLPVTLIGTDLPWDFGNCESILLPCLILIYRILALHVFICLIFWAEVNVMAIYAKWA